MRQEVVRSWPLTPLQLGLLYDSLLSQRTSVNLEQVACHLDDEAFDVATMKQSWEALVRRHEVLRSVYVWRDVRVPSQEVVADIEFEFEQHDLRALAPEQQKEVQEEWRHADRRRGVRLDKASNWRLTWFRWGDRRSSLYWTFHHIMLDGTSFALLLQEALEGYTARLQGEAHVPVTLSPLDFGDYCHALDAVRCNVDAQDEARRFFEAQLHGVFAEQSAETMGQADAPSADGTDALEPMASVEGSITPAEVDGLRALALASDATLGTVVQVAWGILLSRVGGQRDAVFGVVRSGRHIVPQARDTVGCLINTLPVRVALGMGVSIDQLLRAMRTYMLGMRPHEHVFLSDLQAWSEGFASEGRLQSVVMFEPWPLEQRLQSLGGPWLQRRFELHEEGAAEMTLAVYVRGGLDLHLEYDSRRVDAETAKRLMALLQILLGHMARATSDQTVASLDMLTPEDRGHLQAWAAPPDGVSASANCATMARFARTVRRRPSAVAISVLGEQTQLTYAELDARSSQLAHWLRRQSVEEGDRVAICMPRSPEFVVAMLGIMKAGAAYVPIDPGYPAELKEHMASDSGAVLQLAGAGGEASGVARTVRLHTLADELAKLPSTWSDPLGQGHDRPAYVIYTSGSTGKPKGVVVGQHALVAHAAAVTATYGLTEHDRALQFASLSFDVSIEEIVPTLLAGAELVLRNAAVAESVSALWAAVEQRQLTVLNLPTAYWHTCVDQLEHGRARMPACVRLLVVGGEKASRQALDRWRQAVPECRWINGYGPTEATITSTFYEALADKPLPPNADIPIGKPLGHARAYVVAADGSLAPPGVRGELCLGGPCLALGYHGQLELTARQFMTTGGLDPVWEAVREPRIYRTGDLASWSDDGELLYHGRADRQVKVRGFRVELEAVESALAALPGVGRAVVKVDMPNTPAARLLAWVLPAHVGQALDVATLNTELAHRLPEHMRPTLAVIDELPITPGGKIDYRQLVERDLLEQDVDTDSAAAPLSDELQRMTAVFAQVLKRKTVAPEASFFDLGGNSLLAVSLIAAVEREFSCQLSVGTLKASPTPAALHAALSEGSGDDAPQFLVAIQPEGKGIPIYGVHSLGHRERFYRPLAARLGADQPVFGLTSGYTHLHEDALSVEQLAQLYRDDVQKHQPAGPLVLAAVSMCAYIAYELAKQLTDAGREVAYLVLFDSEGPDGRPSIQKKSRVLALHWQQFRKKGPRYLIERTVIRLTNAGGLKGRIGLLLGRAFNMTRGQAFDHPADHAFVQNLALAVSRYSPGTYAGRMVIFYPEDEPFFDLDKAIASGMGWRRYGTGRIDLLPIPGGHISMLDEPNVGTMARRLSNLLFEERSNVGKTSSNG
ncbi:non-ribosomal peptide synthetase [Hydrogenophaga palleronii]|uniref:non-ribosomal peptide synthetase n=1 Tax=Hydrogenophaga palleronii TaxID=65655 RepID=UPI000826007D|nr:non-ribosomal peptide synthetase [Hydrogenophaga palleronii]